MEASRRIKQFERLDRKLLETTLGKDIRDLETLQFNKIRP
jgi:hypothetical protein